MSIYPFICPSIHLPVHFLFICPFIHLSVHLSIYLFICPFIHLSVHLSIYPFICPFIHLSVHLSIYLSIYPFIHSFIHYTQLTTKAIRDYNRARSYLTCVANKNRVPVFADISEATLCCVYKLKGYKLHLTHDGRHKRSLLGTSV